MLNSSLQKHETQRAVDPIEKLLGRSVPRRGVWTPAPPTETEELLAGVPRELLEEGLRISSGAPLSGIDPKSTRYQAVLRAGLSRSGRPEIQGVVRAFNSRSSRDMEVFRGPDLRKAADATNERLRALIRMHVLGGLGKGLSPVVSAHDAAARLRELS